jgi:hypothetical protein
MGARVAFSGKGPEYLDAKGKKCRDNLYELDLSQHDDPIWSAVYRAIVRKYEQKELQRSQGPIKACPDEGIFLYKTAPSGQSDFITEALNKTPPPPAPRNGIREDWVLWFEYLLTLNDIPPQIPPDDLRELESRVYGLAANLGSNVLASLTPF